MRNTLRLDRWAPPGISVPAELKCIGAGLGGSALFSWFFLTKWQDAKERLYSGPSNARILIEGAIMPDFDDILGPYLYGFFIVALCMLALAVWHYSYHHQGGSNSAYLMRRLPDRWEWHRRCLAIPVTAALLSLLLAFLFLCLYYWVYMTFTPSICLTPDQWQKIWSVRI